MTHSIEEAEETNLQTLNEVRQITGIDALNKLSSEQVEGMLRLAAENKLQKRHLQALMTTYPEFVQLQIEALKHMPEAISGQVDVARIASDSQKEALNVVSKVSSEVTEVLKTIAGKSQSERVQEKLAELAVEQGKFVIETTRNMSEKGVAFYLEIARNIVKIASQIVVIVGLGAAGLAILLEWLDSRSS